MKEYCQNFIDRFSSYCLPSVGFDNFSLEELEDFLWLPSHFSLNFRKKKGQGILYGLSHAKLRQSFFNQLFFSDRKEQFCKKLLFSELNCFFPSLDTLKDVTDIGMGSSVYKLDFFEKSYVLKQRKSSHQKFYTSLLSELGWASFNTMIVKSNQYFEISDFVSNHTLRDYFFETNESPSLLIQLAKHAALGDLLGKGDRHFENYVLKEGAIVPIDVSILFWPNNDAWVLRYAQGGMTEFSWLKRYNEDILIEKAKLFFETYQETRSFLETKKPLIQQLIKEHYLEDQALYLAYIEGVFLDSSHAYRHQQYYIEGIVESLRLDTYKQGLKQLMTKPSTSQPSDLLKMYYFADENRATTFFLIDFFNRKFLLDEMLIQQEANAFEKRVVLRNELKLLL